MESVRQRFDLIEAIRSGSGNGFLVAEVAAFHGRKIVEGIAFGCLVATHHSLKEVPRDAKGQWAADKILHSLEKKRFDTFPSPSVLRAATDDEYARWGVKAICEGQPDRRITRMELIKIYEDQHKWLHEANPYVFGGRSQILKQHEKRLWSGLAKIRSLVWQHFISLNGEGFYCTLQDTQFGDVRIQPLSKRGELPIDYLADRT